MPFLICDSNLAEHILESIRRTGGRAHLVSQAGEALQINSTPPDPARLDRDLGYTPPPYTPPPYTPSTYTPSTYTPPPYTPSTYRKPHTGALLGLGLLASLGLFAAQMLGADVPTLPALGLFTAYYVGILVYLRS